MVKVPIRVTKSFHLTSLKTLIVAIKSSNVAQISSIENDLFEMNKWLEWCHFVSVNNGWNVSNGPIYFTKVELIEFAHPLSNPPIVLCREWSF